MWRRFSESPIVESRLGILKEWTAGIILSKSELYWLFRREESARNSEASKRASLMKAEEGKSNTLRGEASTAPQRAPPDPRGQADRMNLGADYPEVHRCSANPNDLLIA
jgi:hypothetical protein